MSADSFELAKRVLVNENKNLRSRLAEAERERDSAQAALGHEIKIKGEIVGKMRAAEAELAKVKAELAKAREALHLLCDCDVSYHDAEIHIPCGTHGEAIRRMRIARAALPPAPESD